MWFQLLLASIIIASLAYSQTVATTEQGEEGLSTKLDKLEKDLKDIKKTLEETQNDPAEYRRLLNLGEGWKYPAYSCDEIAEKKPNKSSGWYWIQLLSSSNPQLIFCDFETELMGQKNWMRVLHLNMSDPQQQCPYYTSHFRLVTQDGLRLCGKSSGSGCKSMYTHANNFAFKRVCGHITAFRYRSTDGFYRHNCPDCTIEDPYVDGISITYGGWHRRKHVWSFAMYCLGNRGTPPNFVGDNYFCETPTHHEHDGVYSHDPLFAGRWFCAELPQPTTQSLEMRLCSDQDLEDEDAMIQLVELYVR